MILTFKVEGLLWGRNVDGMVWEEVNLFELEMLDAVKHRSWPT